MSSWAPTKYKTTNWSAYNEARRRRGSLAVWFDPDMAWRPPLTGKRGRQPSFSDAAIQTCLTMKALFGMPLLARKRFELRSSWAAPSGGDGADTTAAAVSRAR